MMRVVINGKDNSRGMDKVGVRVSIGSGGYGFGAAVKLSLDVE